MTEMISRGLMREAALEHALKVAQEKDVEGALDFHTILNSETPSDDDRKVWDEIKSDVVGTENAISNNSELQSIALGLMAKMLMGEEGDIDLLDMLTKSAKILEESSKGRFKLDPEKNKDHEKIIMTALIRSGLSQFIPGEGGMNATPQSGEGSGPGGPLNSYGFTKGLRDTIEREMREQASLDKDRIGKVGIHGAKQRANALLASLMFSPHRDDQSFAYKLATENPAFQTITGDWLRDYFQANKHITDALAAMQSQMSSEGKRAEEITRSGIEDVDFVRMLASRFPIKIRYAEKPGDESDKKKEWKTFEGEVSSWDVVNYLYGNTRVERGDERVVVSSGGSKVLGKDEKHTLAPGEFVVKNPKKYIAGESFTTESGVVVGKGSEFFLETLSNNDLKKVNEGDVFIYPKLIGAGLFEDKAKVPGSALLTMDADDVARGGSTGYFLHVLERAGIEMSQIRDFENPFHALDINAGLAGEFGAGFLSELEGWDELDSRGQTLAVRNMMVMLNPIFSNGVSMAKLTGQEWWWNPTYDNSRMMKIIENTLASQSYDDAKGITPFEMRQNLLHNQYPDYLGRMAKKAHPVKKSWEVAENDGEKIDMNDRAHPWEDQQEDSVEVSLGPVEVDGGLFKKKRDLETELRAFERKIEYDVPLTTTEKSRMSVATKELETVSDTLSSMAHIDEHLFMEESMISTDWNEKVIANRIYNTAFARVLRGDPVEKVLSDLRKEAEDFAKLIRNKDVKKSGVKAVRNTNGVVAAAYGSTKEEKMAIGGRSLFSTIEGLASSVEESDYYSEMQATHPEMFKGVMGSMTYASEVYGLEQFDFGKGSREIEAWIRYLEANADVYSIAKSSSRAVIHIMADPEILKKAAKAEQKHGADDFVEGLVSDWSHNLAEQIEEVLGVDVHLSQAELEELYKAVAPLGVAWVDSHADIAFPKRRQMYKEFVEMFSQWVEAGEQYLMRSKQAGREDSAVGKVGSGDNHVPLVLDLHDNSLSGEERELVQGLHEIFTSTLAMRVDYNEVRGSVGEVVLSGGSSAHLMEGTIDSKGVWREMDWHKKEVASRMVDRYGMGAFIGEAAKYMMVKAGMDAGLLYREDFATYFSKKKK